MAIRVSLSNDLGLVVIAFEGDVTVAELRNDLGPLLERQEIALKPLLLLDMTSAKRFDGSSEIVREFAQRVSEQVDGKVEAGSKMALVATLDEFFGLGRMYEILRDDSPVEFAVFRDTARAVEWLELPEGYEVQLEAIS